MKLRIDKNEICRQVEQIALYHAAKSPDITAEAVDNTAIIEEDAPMVGAFIDEAIAGAVNDVRWLVDAVDEDADIVIHINREAGLTYLAARLICADVRRCIVYAVAARWLALGGHEGAGQCEEIAEEARRRIRSQFTVPGRRKIPAI